MDELSPALAEEKIINIYIYIYRQFGLTLPLASAREESGVVI